MTEMQLLECCKFVEAEPSDVPGGRVQCHPFVWGACFLFLRKSFLVAHFSRVGQSEGKIKWWF